MTIKTIDIEIKVMSWLDIRANLIVPNICWGMGLHECDILSLSRSGYATEVEIKVSKADLLKDKDKKHGHKSDKIKYLYYAVPELLKDIALAEIPERAGLMIISEKNDVIEGKIHHLYIAKLSKINKEAVKWSEKDRYNLARLGAMRILALKIKVKNSNLKK